MDKKIILQNAISATAHVENSLLSLWSKAKILRDGVGKSYHLSQKQATDIEDICNALTLAHCNALLKRKELAQELINLS